MGDNDFPAVMANGGAFLDGFMKRRGFVSEQEAGQPAQTLLFESQQVLGGPEIAQVVELPETPTALGPELSPALIRQVNQRMFPGYQKVRQRLAGLRGA